MGWELATRALAGTTLHFRDIHELPFLPTEFLRSTGVGKLGVDVVEGEQRELALVLKEAHTNSPANSFAEMIRVALWRSRARSPPLSPVTR